MRGFARATVSDDHDRRWSIGDSVLPCGTCGHHSGVPRSATAQSESAPGRRSMHRRPDGHAPRAVEGIPPCFLQAV